VTFGPERRPLALRSLVAALALASCPSCDDATSTRCCGQSADPGLDGGADSDSDSDSDSDADAGDDSGPDTDTGFDGDCDALPVGPLAFEFLAGLTTGEDIAFDDEGFLIGMAGDLFKSPRDGAPALWVAGAGCASGLRALSTGDVVCNGGGSVIFFDEEDGTKTTVASGLSYPNGIEVDLDGHAYVSEQGSGEVTKIDPFTGENWVIATGLTSPNGLSFSPDYSALYVGSFGGGIVYRIPFESGLPTGGAETFLTTSMPQAQAVGMTGAFDGMGVDACGNVYVCDYGNIHVYRIAPDASTVEVVADLSPMSSWIPNLQWGSGYGGWVEDHLYVSNISGGVFEIDVGVPSKPRGYP
jgi:sugar lactone lactonase YvrE